MARESFYDEAKRGKTSLVIWISSVCVILTSLYFVTGAFSGIVSSIISFAGGIWNPDIYSPNSPGLWKYFWSVFYGWTSGAVFGLAGLYFVQTKLRERPFLRLLTSANRFRYKRVFFAAILALAIKVISIFIQSLYLGNADVPVWSEPQTFPGFTLERTNLSFLIYVIIAPVLALLITLFVIFQEALFRGFIDQGLTRKFSQTLPAFIISAGLFSLWHIWSYDTFYGALPFLISMFIIGFTMSIISSSDEGLEAAIGIQTMWALLYNLGVGATIILLPVTSLWTTGEPKHSAASVLETLILCFALVIILKFCRFGLTTENGDR